MADVIDLATRARRAIAPCAHRRITVITAQGGTVVACADCGAALDPVSAVCALAARLAQAERARSAAQRRARDLAAALRREREANRPPQRDLVTSQTRTDALAAARRALKSDKP